MKDVLDAHDVLDLMQRAEKRAYERARQELDAARDGRRGAL